MKFIYYFRMIFRSVFSQFPLLFLSYVVFPFTLSFFLSSSLSSVLEPVIEDPNIEVYLIDHDQSGFSNLLVEVLQSDELNRVFDVKAAEKDAEFLITIPAGFGDRLIQDPVLPIEIEGKNAASRNTGRILQMMLNELTGKMHESMVLSAQVGSSALNEWERTELQRRLVSIQNTEYVTTETYTSETMLSAREYFGVVVISYLLILFLSSNISAEGMTESIGFSKRWRAAPISKWQAFGMEVMGNTIYFFLFIVLYVTLWRILGGIFNQNPFYLLLIILLQSLIVSLASSFISNTFSNAVGKIIVNFLLFFVLIFGGMLGPLDKITGIPIFEKLNSETVTSFITKPHWALMAYNSWERLAPFISQLVMIIGAFFLLNLISLQFRRKVTT